MDIELMFTTPHNVSPSDGQLLTLDDLSPVMAKAAASALRVFLETPIVAVPCYVKSGDMQKSGVILEGELPSLRVTVQEKAVRAWFKYADLRLRPLSGLDYHTAATWVESQACRVIEEVFYLYLDKHQERNGRAGEITQAVIEKVFAEDMRYPYKRVWDREETFYFGLVQLPEAARIRELLGLSQGAAVGSSSAREAEFFPEGPTSQGKAVPVRIKRRRHIPADVQQRHLHPGSLG